MLSLNQKNLSPQPDEFQSLSQNQDEKIILQPFEPINDELNTNSSQNDEIQAFNNQNSNERINPLIFRSSFFINSTYIEDIIKIITEYNKIPVNSCLKIIEKIDLIEVKSSKEENSQRIDILNKLISEYKTVANKFQSPHSESDSNISQSSMPRNSQRNETIKELISMFNTFQLDMCKNFEYCERIRENISRYNEFSKHLNLPLNNYTESEIVGCIILNDIDHIEILRELILCYIFYKTKFIMCKFILENENNDQKFVEKYSLCHKLFVELFSMHNNNIEKFRSNRLYLRDFYLDQFYLPKDQIFVNSYIPFVTFHNNNSNLKYYLLIFAIALTFIRIQFDTTHNIFGHLSLLIQFCFLSYFFIDFIFNIIFYCFKRDANENNLFRSIICFLIFLLRITISYFFESYRYN